MLPAVLGSICARDATSCSSLRMMWMTTYRLGFRISRPLPFHPVRFCCHPHVTRGLKPLGHDDCPGVVLCSNSVTLQLVVRRPSSIICQVNLWLVLLLVMNAVCHALHVPLKSTSIVRTRVLKESLSETSRFPGRLIVFGFPSMVNWTVGLVN